MSTVRTRRGGAYVAPAPVEPASDDEKLSDNSSADSSSEDEIVVPKKSPARQRATPNTARSTSPAKSAAKPAPANRSSLFDSLAHTTSATLTIVKTWSQRYHQNSDTAFLELLNFLIQSSGCTTRISSEQLDGSREEIVATLLSEEDEAPSAYPLVSKQKPLKRFASRFSDFWVKVVDPLKTDVLYDASSSLFVTIIDWLVALGSCGLVSLRHTCSVAAYSLVSGLIGAAVEQRKIVDDCTRQRSAESKKASANAKRLAQFDEDIQDAEQRLQGLRDLMQHAFGGIFVHRYCDIHPPIRSLSLTALGGWMQELPEEFLKDIYLKYCGWCLNDKDPSVRLASVQAILTLYREPQHVAPMEAFARRFRDRFIEMANDKDPEVAESAIAMVNRLLLSGLLTPDEEKPDQELGTGIRSLVWDDDARVHRAAGAFVYQDLFAVDAEENVTPDKQKDFNKEDINQLVNFHHKYAPKAADGSLLTLQDLSDSVDRMVQAFAGFLPCLQDWDAVTQCLLQQKDVLSGDNQLANRGATILCHLLLSTVKHAMQPASAGEQLATATLHAEVIQGVPQHLAELMACFQADDDKLYPLVQVVRSFPVDKLAKKDLKGILKSCRGIFSKHASESLLQQTARTLMHLTSGAGAASAMKAEAEQVVHELATELLVKFKKLDEMTPIEMDEEAAAALTASIRRMWVLHSHANLRELTFSSELANLLHGHATSDHGNSEVVSILLRYLFIDLLWQYSSLRSAPDVTASSIKLFSDRQHSLMEHLESSLLNKHLSFDVRDQAFDLLCDLLLAFTPALLMDTPFAECLVPLSGASVEALTAHFIARINGDGREDDDAASEVRRHLALTSAAKAIVARYPDLKPLAHRYLVCFSQFDEQSDGIIKLCLNKLRDGGSDQLQDMQLGALKLIFAEYNEEYVKEVASKFCMMYPLDPAKRTFVPYLRDGIRFALKDSCANVAFLRCAVLPYLTRASASDAGQMYSTFHSVFQQSMATADEETQESLRDFINALDRKKDGQKIDTPSRAKASPKRRRAGAGESAKEKSRHKKARSADTSIEEVEDIFEDDEPLNASSVPGTPASAKSSSVPATPVSAKSAKRQRASAGPKPPVNRLKRNSRFS